MKRCLASLANRKMQIKTTMKHHFTPVRMAVITKSTNNKCWRGCGVKRTLVRCWCDCRLVQPLWETVWNFLRKLKMKLPFDPAIPLLGLYPKNLETPIKRTYTSQCSWQHKCWKQPQCPSLNEWVQRLWYLYTMEYYIAERNKELLPFTTSRMELESIILSEISQAMRDKYYIISPLTGT